MSSHKQETPAQQAWPQRQFVDKLTQLTLPAIAILLYSVIQLIRLGGGNNHYLFMLVGSILSVVCAMAYIFASYTHGATGKKSFLGMLLAFAGFVPWAFGSYIVFYQGFWGFAELSTGFSLWLIIKAVVAIVLGYRIVSSMYKITEIDKSVKPNSGVKLPEEQVDDLLATHSSFGSAVVVSSSDEQLTFIDTLDPNQILNFTKSEEMDFKGKNYEVIHFENKVTDQERTLYFDITAFHKNKQKRKLV